MQLTNPLNNFTSEIHYVRSRPKNGRASKTSDDRNFETVIRSCCLGVFAMHQPSFPTLPRYNALNRRTGKISIWMFSLRGEACHGKGEQAEFLA